MKVEGYVILNNCTIQKQCIEFDENETTCDFSPERPAYYVTEHDEYVAITYTEKHKEIKVYRTLEAAKKQILIEIDSFYKMYYLQIQTIEKHINQLILYKETVPLLHEEDFYMQNVYL